MRWVPKWQKRKEGLGLVGMEHKSNGVTPTGQNALEEAPNQSAGEARKLLR